MLILEDSGSEKQLPDDKINTYGLEILPYRNRRDVTVSCTPEDGEYRVSIVFWTPRPESPVGIYVQLHPMLGIDDVGKREHVFIVYDAFKEALFMDAAVDFMRMFEGLFSQFIVERGNLHVARIDDMAYVLLYTGYKPEASSFCGGGKVPLKELEGCIEYDEEEEPSEDALWVKREAEASFG